MNVDLSDDERVQILNSDTLYGIMQRILLREELIDQNREHCWVVSLATNNLLLNIEHISMGSQKRTIADPMEVYSVALQKRSAKVVLVHKYPDGSTNPSEQDKILTDRLFQVGKILDTPLFDHLIITDKYYYSFRETGLLEEISKSTEFIPPYVLKNKYLRQGAEIAIKERNIEIARNMKAKGYSVEDISELTGLSVSAVKRLKV